jgi:hypothetical protein
MVRWDMLSPDLKVCCKIYEFVNEKDEEIWFSKLVALLDGNPSRVTISKCLDKLFDLGIIDGQWKKINNRWTRTFKIAGESTTFIKNIYNSTKNGQ